MGPCVLGLALSARKVVGSYYQTLFVRKDVTRLSRKEPNLLRTMLNIYNVRLKQNRDVRHRKKRDRVLESYQVVPGERGR